MLGSSPVRCTLVNVDTAERFACQFNPESLTERNSVRYARLEPYALSHQVMHYLGTDNRKLTQLRFYVDRATSAAHDSDQFRRFLRAFTMPSASRGPACPPRLLLIWPQVLTLEGFVTELEFSYQQFASDGRVMVYTAQMTLEEARRRPHSAQEEH